MLTHASRRGGWKMVTGTVALTVVAVAGCSSGSSSGGNDKPGNGSSYRVVVVNDETGPLGPQFGPGGAGAKAKVYEINRAGGINGHKIDLEVIDGQSNLNLHLAALRKAASEQPTAIVQIGLSSAIEAGANGFLKTSNSPVLTVSAPDDLLYPARRNIYDLEASPTQTGNALVSGAEQVLASKDLAGKRVAIVDVDSAFTKATGKAIETRAIKDGAKVVEHQTIPIVTTSFTSQASQIAGTRPDVVLLVVTAAETPIVASALKVAGYKGPMVEQQSGNTPTIFKQIADPNFYALRSVADVAETPLLKSAASAAGVGGQATNSWFTQGWVLMSVLGQALTDCKNACSGGEVLKALDGLKSFEVPGKVNYGPIMFSSTDHAGVSAMQLYKWDPAARADVIAGAPIQVTR